jgi:GT2 family glycosyltransferase
MSRSALIVCTRNRPADIRRLLASMARDRSASVDVLIVDSSDNDTTRVAVAGCNDRRVRYARCAPGLTRQRMAGVSMLAREVEMVHFVDDDVVLETGYVGAIEAIFDTDPLVLGVGGRITNLPDHTPRLLWRLFLLDSVRGGAILRSGVNVLPFGVPDRGRVEWLSGCSMSFRRSVFAELSFDLGMEDDSLGEDVDFTTRVARRGHLCIADRARLAHLSSIVNRENKHRRARREIVARHRRVCGNNRGGAVLAAFWWAVAGDILLNGTNGALRLRRDSLRRSWAVIRAVGDIARARLIGPNARLRERSSDG